MDRSVRTRDVASRKPARHRSRCALLCGSLFALVGCTSFWLTSAASALAPKPIPLSYQGSPQSLMDGVQFLADVEGTATFEQIRQERADKFRPLTEPALGWTTHTYWLRFAVHWGDAPRPVVIAAMRNNVEHATAHIEHEGRPVVRFEFGRNAPLLNRYEAPAAFPCLGPPDSTSTIWLRVRHSDTPLTFDVFARDRDDHLRMQVIQDAQSWLFAGALLMLALYQAVIYLGSRDRAALLYVGVALTTAAMDMVSRGNIQQLVPVDSYPIPAGAFPLVLLVLGLSWCLFTRVALDMPRYSTGATRSLDVISAATVVLILLSPVFPPRFMAIMSFGSNTPVMVGCLVAGALAARRGCLPARVYLLTWAAAFACTGVAALSFVVGTIDSELTGLLFKLGPLCQVIGFALVLSQRAAALRADLQDSQTREMAAQRDRIHAQENALRVEKEAAENLHRRVDERTAQLAEEKREADLQREDAQTAHARVEELDRQKTRFFQNISHELRTPLTLVLNPLEEIVLEQQDDPRLRLAERNARRLLRLVNQLLDFQKISAGHQTLKLQNVDLVRFAWVCGDYVRNACASRDIRFVVELDHEPITEDELGKKTRFIQGDTDALEKVVFNYLGNAMKFTPAGGDIRLQLLTEGRCIRIVVADTGPGILPANRGKLFQLFSQVDDSSTREFEGSGLGLALARELTEAMKGEVGVETDEGQGSRFWSTFPSVAPPAEEADQAALDDFEVKPWLLADQSPPDNDKPLDEPVGAGAHVMVVDDLPDMRELIKGTLKKNGYRVSTAKDGVEALYRANELNPELIITDWMMPRKSGLQVIEDLRAHSTLRHIPVVLLTARSDEEGKLLGMEVGADAFLGKPFNEQELCATVRNLLALKSHEKELAEAHKQLQEGVLKRYLPPALVNQIIAGGGQSRVEHESRAVTLLSADLVGFTEMTRKLRASSVARILNRYLSEMTRVIFEHGGTIDRISGESLTLLFGAPETMESSEQAKNALRCALAMQEAMQVLNQAWASEGLEALRLRVGIHHGPAVVGNFGSEQRLDYTAVGETVHTAGRVRQNAQPGQVLLSPAIADLLPEELVEQAGSFEMEDGHSRILYGVPVDAGKYLSRKVA